MEPEQLAVMKMQLDRMEIQLSEVLVHIIGSPTHNVPGLAMRVDRLERAEARRTWTMRAAITAAFGALANSIWSLFHKV